MKIASRFLTAALVLSFAATAVRAQQLQPAMIVAGPSYNTVVSKLNYVGKLAGQPQLGQQVEGLVALFTQGQGIPGLDKDKPCGAALFFSANQEPMFVVFVPVADIGPVARVFQLPLQPDPQREGVLMLPSPTGQPAYVKSQNGWTWLVSGPQLLDKLPKDPSGWIGPLAKKYDLALQFRFKAIPKQFWQEMEKGMQAALEEADEQQQAIVRAQLQQFQQMLQSLDAITLGVQIDEQNRQFALDMEIAMSPGSQVGRVLASAKAGPTRMMPFVPQESILRMLVTSTMGKEGQDFARQQLPQVKEMLLELLEKNKEEYPDEESYQAIKQLAEQGFELYAAMVQSSKVDVGFSMENQDGKLFANFAMALPPGHKAEQLVKRLLGLLEAEDFSVQANAASQDGVTYHRVPLKSDDAQVQAMLNALFGEDASLVLATGPQGCYTALGPKALEQLQQRITASRTQPPRQAAHYEEVVFSVRPLLELVQKHIPHPALALVADALPPNEKAQLRLFVDIEGTKERVRVEVDESLVRLLVQVAMTVGAAGPGGPPAGLPGAAPPDF